MADKRLIPFSIKNIEDNKWSVQIDENEPFEVEGDESQMRKIALRMKAKNGDGTKHKRSSKNGTYISMLDGETHYCWKSKCPKNAEEFKSLMESKDPKEVFDEVMNMNEDDYVDYMFDELSYMSDEEIIEEFDKYVEDMQVGTSMSTQLPTNIKYKQGVINMYESKEKVIEPKEFESWIRNSIEYDKTTNGKILDNKGNELDVSEVEDFLIENEIIITLWNKSMTCDDDDFDRVLDKLSRAVETELKSEFKISITVY